MTTKHLKSMDFAQRQLAHNIFYVDLSPLPPGFKYHPIIFDNFKKMKPLTGISRAFSDYNRRHFTLNVDQLFIYYTPKAVYSIDQITYLPLEELSEIRDKPHYMVPSSGPEWNDVYGFTLYFSDRYIILIAQTQAIYDKWMNHLELIRFKCNGRSVLTRQRTKYLTDQRIPPPMQYPQVQNLPKGPATGPILPEPTTMTQSQQRDSSNPPKQSTAETSSPVKTMRRLSQPAIEKQQGEPIKEQPEQSSKKPIENRVIQQMAPNCEIVKPPTPSKSIRKTLQQQSQQQVDSGLRPNKLANPQQHAPNPEQNRQSEPQLIDKKTESHRQHEPEKYDQSRQNGQRQHEPKGMQEVEEVKAIQFQPLDNREKPMFFENSLKPIKPTHMPKPVEEQTVKIIGDNQTQTERGRSFVEPQEITHKAPIRLDSAQRRTIRKPSFTGGTVEVESPDKVKASGRSNSRNIWQDHDNDGNVIIRPQIMTANFTGNQRHNHQSQPKPVEKQIESQEHSLQNSKTKPDSFLNDEDQFNEEEFMSQLLGMKKVELSPPKLPQKGNSVSQKWDIPIHQVNQSPEPIQSKVSPPRVGFFLANNLVTEEDQDNDVPIPNFDIGIPAPPQPKPKTNYDDWDDDL